jgi:hypothetical protein
MPFMNLCAVVCSIINPVTKEVITSFPAADKPAKVIPGDPGQPFMVDGVPVVGFTKPARVDGIPFSDSESHSIIVPSIVAEAMRQLGMVYGGGVFTPQMLVMENGKPLGTPGLIFQRDISTPR